MTKAAASDDELAERATDLLLNHRLAPQSAVVRLVLDFPDATGLQIVYCLIEIVGGLERWRPADEYERTLPALIFRECGLLAAELHALERQRRSPATARDIVQFWRGRPGRT